MRYSIPVLLLVAVLASMTACSLNPFESQDLGERTENLTINNQEIPESDQDLPEEAIPPDPTEYDIFSPDRSALDPENKIELTIEEIPDGMDTEDEVPEGLAKSSRRNKIYSAKVTPSRKTINSGERVRLKVRWKVKIYRTTRGRIYIDDRLTGTSWSKRTSKLRGRSKGRRYYVTVYFNNRYYKAGKHIIDSRMKLDTGESDSDRNEAKITVKGSNGGSDGGSNGSGSAGLVISSSLKKKLDRSTRYFYWYMKLAIKYQKVLWRFTRYLPRILSWARSIGQSMNDLAIGRDRVAEQAFQMGWDHGIRGAKRLKDKIAVYDVNWRAYWRKKGHTYMLCYDGGYAAGFKHEMEKK